MNSYMTIYNELDKRFHFKAVSSKNISDLIFVFQDFDTEKVISLFSVIKALPGDTYKAFFLETLRNPNFNTFFPVELIGFILLCFSKDELELLKLKYRKESAFFLGRKNTLLKLLTDHPEMFVVDRTGQESIFSSIANVTASEFSIIS